MRILFLTQVLPYPLDAGPKTRAYYVLRYLAQYHEIVLVSFVREGDGPEALEHLRSFCQSVVPVPIRRSRAADALHLVRSVVGGSSFIIVRDWLPAMRASLMSALETLGPFDYIHADQLWMAAYARWAQRSAPQPRPPRLVLDQHNAVYKIAERLAEHETNPFRRRLLHHESRKLARYEIETCRAFDRVVWVTNEDFTALEREAGRAGAPLGDPLVIPICGDTSAEPVVPRREAPAQVTFLGGLHWPPNAAGVLWFVREVWPEVKAAVPAATFVAIGKQPPAELTAAQVPGSGIRIAGYVADPIPHLMDTAAFVVPLQAGGGMRVKIIDAWKWGLPVVSTAIGAEGIACAPGRDLLMADTPDDFANAVIRLLTDPAFGAELASAGRAAVETRYDWRRVYPAWDQVYA